MPYNPGVKLLTTSILQIHLGGSPLAVATMINFSSIGLMKDLADPNEGRSPKVCISRKCVKVLKIARSVLDF